MKKIVKKWSNSLIILFDSEDAKIYGIEEGDVIDISDIVVLKKKVKNNGS